MRILLLILLTSRIAVSQSASREQRELRMADQAILGSIAVARSPEARHLCSSHKLACVGPDRAELGLALIGARQTRASRSALIDVLPYRLDGSGAEDYRCYVLNAGGAIKGDLLAANPDSLSARCVSELHRITRNRQASFEGLDESMVCSDPRTVKQKISDLVDGITRGIKCGPQDF